MPHIDTIVSILEQRIDELEQLIVQFADGASCQYDHHGYCQTHFLHDKPCPYGIANEMANNES